MAWTQKDNVLSSTARQEIQSDRSLRGSESADGWLDWIALIPWEFNGGFVVGMMLLRGLLRIGGRAVGEPKRQMRDLLGGDLRALFTGQTWRQRR